MSRLSKLENILILLFIIHLRLPHVPNEHKQVGNGGVAIKILTLHVVSIDSLSNIFPAGKVCPGGTIRSLLATAGG
jgi:hypothetical protein